MDEQESRQGPLGRSNPLHSERGTTSIAYGIADGVVQKIAGIAALEVEEVHMSGAARAVGGFLESVPGGGGITRGVSVEVGELETAIHLTMAVECGRPIPPLLEKVRRNVTNGVGGLVGLDVVGVNITVNDLLLPEERQPRVERRREVEREVAEG